MNTIYDSGLIDKEYVMRGNAAVMRCLIPSFVADFVYIDAWVDDEGTEYTSGNDYDKGTDEVFEMVYDTYLTPLFLHPQWFFI